MSLRDHIDALEADGVAWPDVDRRKATAIVVFLVPGLTLFGIFSVGPIVYSAVGSFFSWDGFTIESFTGLDNWIRTFADPHRQLGQHSALAVPDGRAHAEPPLVVLHVPISTLLGLGMALLFVDLKGRRILRSMVFSDSRRRRSSSGSSSCSSTTPGGIFNELLRVIGLGGQVRNWTQSPQVAIYALIAGGIWVQTGFNMLLYSSALAAIDPSLIESAKVDGAGRWRRFWDITWPLVRPVTAVVVIMGIIWVMRVFDIVYAAGGSAGGPNHAYSVLGIEVYRAAFEPPIDYGKAMVVALVQLVIVARSRCTSPE